ncbi:MAG TPA: radical SAM protein [Bryobacteraceae bacterium]|nr:radical SAM protein [Bryobacteraceae bacterium]
MFALKLEEMLCGRQLRMGRRRLRAAGRRLRESRMFARAMVSKHHPILAQIVPTRRCNLACTYCNEFDAVSAPVPLAEMLRRVDLLAGLGTTIITISGGEPMLHPDLDEIIRRVRRHGAIATLITNGYLLTAERIRQLNRAGLDYLQISIDNVVPDETSKKSLKVLGRKLELLAEHAEFAVTVNSVLGSPVRNPEDARTIAQQARELGLTSTVGILHDGDGQLRPLAADHLAIYRDLLEPNQKMFEFAQYDRFQRNISQGLPNQWHCRAGGRFLYICEDGLVHYCSQQRGHPAIPLERYTRADLEREAAAKKACAPFCTISCVHQTAMLDSFRENPRQVLTDMIAARKERDPGYRPPALLGALTWMFLDGPVKRVLGRIAVRVLRAQS